jgi:uncharacterized protein
VKSPTFTAYVPMNCGIIIPATPFASTSWPPKGNYTTITLGIQPEIPSYPQVIIPARTNFAAEVVCSLKKHPDQKCAGYGLVGCVVAPGFEFEDFELCSRDSLLAQYPDLHDVIMRFTLP